MELECPVCKTMMTVAMKNVHDDIDDMFPSDLAHYGFRGNATCSEGHEIFAMLIVSEFKDLDGDETEEEYDDE
jgi:hypothetical protein